MERNRNELTRSFVEQQPGDMVADHLDSELASAYAANLEISLEITEEFAAVDQEGF